MRINWSKIILALALILIGGLFYSANSINSKRSVNNIIIEFESSNKLFITKDSILKLIPTDYSDKNSIDINISKFKYSIIDVDLADKGIFYRLRVGPFKSENDVHEVCKVFKIDKKNCIILEESTDKA